MQLLFLKKQNTKTSKPVVNTKKRHIANMQKYFITNNWNWKKQSAPHYCFFKNQLRKLKRQKRQTRLHRELDTKYNLCMKQNATD